MTGSAATALPYWAMAIEHVTGVVTRMRKGSYWFRGVMLEISGRPGK